MQGRRRRFVVWGGADGHNGLGWIGVAILLVSTCLCLLLTAPSNGDFWCQDAPRHALNGAFVKDFAIAHPIADPAHWAIDYYLRRPALTILFYPPVFYGFEAVAFAAFGVSNFVAQATVTVFLLLLAGATYVLSRMYMPRWSAVGAALLVVGTPETAFWGRQVMLDVPAYALIVTSACCLMYYLKSRRPWMVYLMTLFLLAAIYTKYNAGFVAPAFAAAFVIAKGKAFWRDRHAMVAGAIGLAGLLPAALMMFSFGQGNIESVSSLQGSPPLSSLACWLFYLQALPAQMGYLTVVLAGGGLVVMVWSLFKRDSASYGLLLAWFLCGYFIFSIIILKETRHTIMVLLPLALAGPMLLLAILPRPAGEAAGLMLGVSTLVYTLIYCPVPRVEGYQEIAAYLATEVPRDGVVVYSGFRDGNLVFDLAAVPGRTDIVVVRADKLLVSVPFGERRRGVKEADYDEARLAELLRSLGASYFVVQPGFWSDIAAMKRFGVAISGTDYEKVRHFDLTGDLSTSDGRGGIDVYRPTYAASDKPGHLDLEMPFSGQRFQGDLPGIK